MTQILINENRLEFVGDFSKNGLQNFKYKFSNPNFQNLIFDLSKIENLDSIGAEYIIFLKNECANKSQHVELFGLKQRQEDIISLALSHQKSEIKQAKKSFNPFYNLGKITFDFFNIFISFSSFSGGAIKTILINLINPGTCRIKATLALMQKNGFDALGIVTLTSLLIGIIIAFQGAVQLQKFGANIFIVEMVGISITRELAPLIVAIIIAGRSASAYTAELGVMKITDEIDAMKTMGFSPWNFLVAPRILALVISMPLLVIYADILGIFGGMIIANNQLEVSFFEFLDRFNQTVSLTQFIIGIAKAPFFGLIISLIACFRGFQITSSTQSVGLYTTKSVVNAIFWVIAFDALVSVILTKANL